MKKIIFGLVLVVVAVGLVGAAAYAGFNTFANVNGMAFSTGTAKLKVAKPDWHDGHPSCDYHDIHWDTTVTFGYVDGWKFLIPGGPEATRYICIKNESDDSINLKLSAQLIKAGDDPVLWDMFKDVTSVEFQYGTSTPSGYATLNNWFVGGPYNMNVDLMNHEPKLIKAIIKLDSGTPNEAQGKTLPTDWKITGTQI